MAGSKKKDAARGGGPDPNAWMVTFGDLIMLMLTFFVMLLTMKSMDSGQLKERFQELAATSGPLDYSENIPGGSIVEGTHIYKKSLVVTNNNMLEEMLDLLEGMERKEAEKHHLEELRKLIDIKEDSRGVIIVMECDRLFDSGRAEIRPDQLPIIDGLGLLFRSVLNDILIIGHTDDRPLRGGDFRSNLELSAYRALSVLYYLTEGLGLHKQRYAAGGFGDLRPQYSNADEAGRAKNRRVEFILRKPT